MRMHLIYVSGCRSCLLLLSLYSLVCVIFLLENAEARFASQLSLTVGEEYNDNIFFEENKEHDFVTYIVPTFTLMYQPLSLSAPTFTVNLSPAAEIYARHSELDSFGKDLGLNVDYVYRYSPRLTFNFSDRLQRRGKDRGVFSGFETGGGFSGFTGGVPDLGNDLVGSSLNDNDLLSRGERIENYFEALGNFQYSPTVTFNGGYRWAYTAFLDEGGKEVEYSLEAGGAYRKWQQHNLRAHYRIGLIKSRDGKNDIVHDIDLGDDFFSSREIRLTPTLTVRAATGIALSTGDDGVRINNRLELIIIKVWQTAALTTGINRRFTGSGGVSGPSFTTTFFSAFTIQLSRRLTANAGVDFSLYDTDDGNFKTIQTLAGIQYWLTGWLSANLTYSYRWLDPEGGVATTGFLSNSKTDSNGVFLSVSAYFDLWPNIGLARGMGSLRTTPSRGMSYQPVRPTTP